MVPDNVQTVVPFTEQSHTRSPQYTLLDDTK
jgi:hypothetical protein